MDLLNHSIKPQVPYFLYFHCHPLSTENNHYTVLHSDQNECRTSKCGVYWKFSHTLIQKLNQIAYGSKYTSNETMKYIEYGNIWNI